MVLRAISFDALGTTTTVVVDGGDDAADAAVAAVQAELAAVDLACSRFRPDSELSRLNAAGGDPVPAGPRLLEAVAVALRAARLTGGLVDPTIGRALRALGYDRDFHAMPVLGGRASGVVTLLSGPAPGWRVVELDPVERTITVPAGVELDLGATAKALAADWAAAAAHQACGRGVLVSLGGDVAVAGHSPPGGWSIRVSDDCRASIDAPGESISITAGGLATSSTTVRRWRQAGTDVHHLIDPSTGRPAGPAWRTVSVAARTCVDANIASTAAVVLGAAAADWLVTRRLPARLVAVDGAVTRVGGWPAP
jgi:thiamine biosynthesis lipoprotein